MRAAVILVDQYGVKSIFFLPVEEAAKKAVEIVRSLEGETPEREADEIIAELEQAPFVLALSGPTNRVEVWRDPTAVPVWLNTDPRISINKRADIIILRPACPGPGEYFVGGKYMAGTGQVETKHGWYIHTSFADHHGVDDWDPTWLWTWAPRSDA